MKKKAFWLLAICLFIQVIRPEKNNTSLETKLLDSELNVPADVHDIMKKACYDCHSNYTNYVWYADVAPVSWLIANHVSEGKEHLNFSEWSLYNSNQKNHIIKEFIEEVEEGKMPMESYVLMHPEAALNKIERGKLLNWVRSLKK